METNGTVHSECQMQGAWGKQFEKNKTIEAHIKEAEKEGGHRDRIAKLEIEMQIIMRSGKYFLLASFVGGVLGYSIPGLANMILSKLFR